MMKKTTEELKADFDKAYIALSLKTGITLDSEMQQRYKAAIGFMRNYAVEAIVDVGFPMDDVNKLNVLLKLLASTDNDLLDLQFIAKMSEARWAVDSIIFGIDDPDNANHRGLTVEQLAFLADLRPQTVRNMQVKDANGNPKNSDGLQTVIIDGQTLVDAETAAKWLKGRPGYKKTVRISAQSKDRDWGKNPLIDLTDLANYLRDIRREGKSDTLIENQDIDADCADFAKLCEKLDLEDEWIATLKKLEDGNYYKLIDEFPIGMEGLCVCWADIHNIDAEAFVFAVLALHIKLLRTRVKERVQENHAYYRLIDRLPTRPAKTISIETILSIIEGS